MKRLILSLLSAATMLVGGGSFAAEVTRFPANGEETAVLGVHGSTDLIAMEPIIRDFQALSPGVTVVYSEYLTSELEEAARRDCDRQGGSMDVLLSSAVDQLVKLVNDGCARPHRSAETERLPAWSHWRGEVFGFTFEPAVIAYHRDLVPREEVPRTRTALIDLMRNQPDRYRGRIGTYDVTTLGVGYLLASIDARSSPVFGRLLEAFARSSIVTRCCTLDLVSEMSAGRILIAYNLIGSYAVGAQRRGAPIGIVLPEDYTLVLSRAVMLPRYTARNPVAERFIDYLLSARGQAVAQRSSFFFSWTGPMPEGVEGPPSLALSTRARPVVIGPALLAEQDLARKRRFLAEWSAITRGEGR